MPAIQAVNLGKTYQIQKGAFRPTTLVETITQGAASLLSRLVRRQFTPHKETFWALRELDFEIPEGEAIGLIGHNGSGKSTLLKILSKITEPSTGSVRLTGRVASLLEVGTGFHHELSARQNIFLNGAILGMRRKEVARHLDEIVDFAGIEDFLEEPVKHLSSGMYMRLAFGVAAYLDSEILLVDEVLAVGDVKFQEKCLGTMRNAAKSGRTVIFVSHNLTAVSELTKRALVLDRGHLIFDGPTATATRHYVKAQQSQELAGRLPTDQIECQAKHREGDSIVIQEMGFAPAQSAEIPPGGAVRMEFLIEAKRRFENLRIGYSLNSATGQPLLTGLSADFSVSSGRHLIELCIFDLQLAPGDYDFSINLGRGSWSDSKLEYDSYMHFGRLKITTTTSDGGLFGQWHRHWGAIYHRASELRTERMTAA